MTQHNQFALLKDKRFAPLFVTQFLGAFHDNIFKNALVVLLLFGTAMQAGENAKMLTTLAAGLFILPFVLFSAMGGQLADKFPKEQVIRKIKIAEIGIAILGSLSLLLSSTALCFMTLFALGTQSAFFGPSKYSILPQHIAQDELIGGNALLNTGTFLAILFGTIAGTVLVTLPFGKLIVATIIMITALTGYITSCHILPAPPKEQNKKIDLNPFRETYDILKYTFSQRRDIVLAVMGVAWFWFLGSTFMAQLPNFVHEDLNAEEQVLTILLVLFSIGIALGGLLNNRLLKGRVIAAFAPLAALGITLFSIDLYFASSGTPGLTARIALDIFMIAVCGGLFVVPLNAIIQDRTDGAHRARVIAGNAIMNALFGVLSALLCIYLIRKGFEVREIFLTVASANIFIIYLTAKKSLRVS